MLYSVGSYTIQRQWNGTVGSQVQPLDRSYNLEESCVEIGLGFIRVNMPLFSELYALRQSRLAPRIILG